MIKQAVILAAGRGNRMKKGSIDPTILNTPKPLLRVNGTPMIETIADKLVSHGMEVIVVVHPEDKKKFEDALSKYVGNITYCLQEDRLGTASALYAAKDAVKDDLFLVFMGDDITKYDIDNIRKTTRPSVFGYRVDDVSGYGALLLDGDEVLDILEKKLNGPGVANTGVYVMPHAFFDIYSSIPKDERSGEYFLTHAVRLLRDANTKFYLRNIDFWFGVNTPEQLAAANATFNLASRNGLSDNEQLRLITRDDLKEVLNVLYQLSPPGGKDDAMSPEILSSVLGEIIADKNHHMAVYEDNSRVVGTATLLVQRNLSHGGKPYGHIENVVVDNSYRGKGVGLKLLKYLINIAREEGCYKLVLNCNDSNIPFYEKIGFRVHEREMRLDL